MDEKEVSDNDYLEGKVSKRIYATFERPFAPVSRRSGLAIRISPLVGKGRVDMRHLVVRCMGIGAFVVTGLWLAQTSIADESSAAAELTLETLLSTQLEGVEGTEVIVSRVVMPPNTALPKHWHPGEEFAYVLEGSTILRRDGKPDLTAQKGELVKIPLKEIHSAVTTDQGATILVFRVHEHGKPERILVD